MDVCGGGLGDVDRSALVLHHLWRTADGRACSLGYELHDRHGGAVAAISALRGLVQAQTPSRPRQIAAGFRDAVGILQLLAAAHRVVGKPAGRDPLVYRAVPWRLGLCKRSPAVAPLHAAVRIAAL